MLLCTKCDTEKDESEFSTDNGALSRGRKNYWCRACLHDHYVANRDRHKASCRARAVRNRYGLTLNQYDAMVAKGCEVCGEQTKRIVIDHCHERDVVRGPLCDGCNLALGGAKDSPNTLRALADYVERHAAT